jgi:superfamily II DNA or RNA helicase
MSRPRLLLADGVGLGKTIQAGLVLTELIARRIAHRILIVSPAGPLLEQWKVEMAERFGLRLDTIDRARLEEIRKGAELGSNPFDHIPLGLVSIDFLKQERVLDQLERSSYDVVIIDEAHHCMDLGAATEREDSQRRRLAQLLAQRCDALLLLTATPHDGNDRSFASLCELLDPSLVDGRGVLCSTGYRAHVVRRLKHHIKDSTTGKPLFKERIVTPIAVTPDAARHPQFTELQHALIDLIAPELRRAYRSRRYSDVLSFIALLKRSVSTVAACQSTLAVVAERFQALLTQGAESQEGRRQRLRTLRESQRKLERFGTVTPEEEEEYHLLEVEDLAQRLADLQREVRSGSRRLKRTADVVAALDDLVCLAEEAMREDPKLDRLVDEIQAIWQEEPNTNVLIYTEYTTSQRATAEALHKAGMGTVLTMSGDHSDTERQQITERFRSQDGLVLVSTDTAAEGLNLHDRCHHLMHLELPFNPNRLEQRNGRIDRYGQVVAPIVRYLYLRGTFEERILLRLIAKYERQRARLTFVPNTLGIATASDAASERLLKGLLEEDTRLFQEEGTLFEFTQPDTKESVDAATQELLEEIDRSLNGFERTTQTHAWLGDAGLNAEEQLLTEASTARGRGDREGAAVDLVRFVTEAILLDGGDMAGHIQDESFAAVLPPSWLHGLDDLPGYDPDSRRVYLTNRLEVTNDAQGHHVGFLGRSHPLVRRALDRVRNLSFGAGSRNGQDPRVSAVVADVQQPTLLYTFLGRVMSQAGREFERVIAVEVSAKEKPCAFLEAEAWLPRADPARAIRTSGVWEQHFAHWASGAHAWAREMAQNEFQILAASLIDTRRRSLEAEVNVLEQWLAQRTRDLTGTVTPAPQQRELFEQQREPTVSSDTPLPAWSHVSEPAERLAAFAMDTSQSPARRSEADGVLRIHRQRQKELLNRLAFGTPEIVPLGVLMMIPESHHGV